MAESNTKSKTSEKLIAYSYQCKNQRGQVINGEILAQNLSVARANLRRQGLSPVKVKKKPIDFLALLNNKKVTAAEIAFFSRQMATMMTAGVPLVQSFDIVAKGTDNSALKALVMKVKSDVEAGKSFSEALEQQKKHFDDLFCNLVAAGEASGSLEAMLDRIASYKEKSETLKRKIKKALFYPTAVVIVAIVVTAILLIFVVPQFEELFKGFGADLPYFTKMVVNLSNIMQKFWYIALAFSIAAGWLFVWCKGNIKAFKEALERLSLKLPVIGKILTKACIARFARTLSTTFSAGVPLVEALDSVAGAVGNVVYYNATLKIKDEVSTGTQVQSSMRNTKVFPNMVIQMVAIGEESGSIDEMLEKIADIYEEEVDTMVDGLSSLLEPLIMVVLGVLVGALVIAMYLPIFKMGSVI